MVSVVGLLGFLVVLAVGSLVGSLVGFLVRFVARFRTRTTVTAPHLIPPRQSSLFASTSQPRRLASVSHSVAPLSGPSVARHWCRIAAKVLRVNHPLEHPYLTPGTVSDRVGNLVAVLKRLARMMPGSGVPNANRVTPLVQWLTLVDRLEAAAYPNPDPAKRARKRGTPSAMIPKQQPDQVRVHTRRMPCAQALGAVAGMRVA